MLLGLIATFVGTGDVVCVVLLPAPEDMVLVLELPDGEGDD